ncbi:TadE-like protein [Sinosporangium album]|uniref:TadE-like protein n=1 Tax=Sinosporangium album TaxID=504805 RepID=A0A1G7U4P5_9ACTN|nr:TadE family type IV pilus minor pilin [Sinosporangium album]SDG42358.1 TadE-like protein [Sinosporangium album]
MSQVLGSPCLPSLRAVLRSRGSITAETAAVLPVIVVVLAASLWMIAIVDGQLRCVDAARTGARAAARGESPDQVRQAVASSLPSGAHVVVTRDGGAVRVEVAFKVRPEWGNGLPGITVRATAVSAAEPGEPGEPGEPHQIPPRRPLPSGDGNREREGRQGPTVH